jgi:hypothetical protein
MISAPEDMKNKGLLLGTVEEGLGQNQSTPDSSLRDSSSEEVKVPNTLRISYASTFDQGSMFLLEQMGVENLFGVSVPIKHLAPKM